MAMVGGLDYFIMLLGFIPARLSGLIELPGVPALLTPLTSTVVHGGWLHLGINMLMLMIVGPQVERVVGTGGLVAAYVAGAVAAAAAQYFVDPASNIPVIGASGAISALFGLYAIFFGTPKPFTQNVRLNRWIHIAWLLAAWVVIQLMTGALAGGQGMLLAIPAHIGGFVAGLALHRPLLLWRYRKA
ncbi:rhomboid family intramembrane serine protease [Sphingomonas sp. LY160]|uniref:rhomboid family intramembrane serine protease n=1 Tax=Sphingomonas sp. LY160 TaxID=3095342 RepID=UPI002ADEE544|nr:rhomboid family intramembrane serine protease [Sphingomonas sp. LY160]MEA1071210.1 rhomboid family intramembrane serine protease [Sphingomonas sp. LY160]